MCNARENSSLALREKTRVSRSETEKQNRKKKRWLCKKAKNMRINCLRCKYLWFSLVEGLATAREFIPMFEYDYHIV